MKLDHIIFSSYGNDSVALIQWAIENKITNISVIYNDTGWAEDSWYKRVEAGEAYCQSHGVKTYRTSSEGMEALVRRKKGWPMCAGPMQFCTMYLKKEPAQRLLDEIDPNGEAVCMTAIRREESQNRANHPEEVEESESHGGRTLWSPLVNVKEKERDDLVNKTTLPVLPHRSRECFPCICSNRTDLRDVTEARVDFIENIEQEMGFTKNGKPRVMFRPYRHQGAIGIREVMKWANKNKGQYVKDDPQLSFCDAGFCTD